MSVGGDHSTPSARPRRSDGGPGVPASSASASPGRPALDADEMRTSDRDSTASEVVALIAVFVGLVVHAPLGLDGAGGGDRAWPSASGGRSGGRRWRVGELNLLSTVFLIALIGIGMDYLIQILTRYRREARRYVRPAAVWARVFRYVGPPIITACLGAAGAFLVSALTDFRGAADWASSPAAGCCCACWRGTRCCRRCWSIFPAKLDRRGPRRPATPRRPQPRRRCRRFAPPAAVGAGACSRRRPVHARGRSFNPNLLDLQAAEPPVGQARAKAADVVGGGPVARTSACSGRSARRCDERPGR